MIRIIPGTNSEIINQYDNIFIDCPPSLSLLTIMALVSANEILVPLQTEFFALEGITQLVKTIDRIKINLNGVLRFIIFLYYKLKGVFISKYLFWIA